MQKNLYLICPTDCIESKINKTFKYENYFYTSLGNSFLQNTTAVEHIRQTVKKHGIRKITFVLSMDNKIILDALGEHNFSDIAGLHNFYHEILQQKKQSKIAAKSSDNHFSIISYYLNKKIKELQLNLHDASNLPIQISGIIYNKQLNLFTPIYSDLVCLEKHHLN